MERDIRIAHHTDGLEPAYDVFIDGITPRPQPLTSRELAPIVETIYREDAPDLSAVAHGDAGVHVDRRILTPSQVLALRGLTVAYQFLRRRQHAS